MQKHKCAANSLSLTEVFPAYLSLSCSALNSRRVTVKRAFSKTKQLTKKGIKINYSSTLQFLGEKQFR